MRAARTAFHSSTFGLRQSASLMLGVALALALTSQPMQAQPPTLKAPAPPLTTEADRVARQLGNAEMKLVNWVIDHSGPLNGVTFAGEYRISYTITPAEAWWDIADDGNLAWHDAPANNVHLRVFVLDRQDGRLVPNLRLRVMLTDERGNRHPAAVDFGWYPLINAYGGNIALDTDGTYALRVDIDADPELSLHSPHSAPLEAAPEERIARITVAEFPPVAISREEISGLPLATASAAAVEQELLKPFNEVLRTAIAGWWRHAAAGEEKPMGDYFVAYAVKDSAGFGTRLKNLLDFSGKDEMRLALLVRDSRSGRILPGLEPQVTLVEAGSDREAHPSPRPVSLAPAWHPWLTPYANRVQLRPDKRYRLHVHAAAPGFRRWGRESGRFGSDIDIEFSDVSLDGTGRAEAKGTAKP